MGRDQPGRHAAGGVTREARGPSGAAWRLSAGAALLVCFGAYALWAAVERITGADLWWALAAGRHIVEHGSLPRQDVLSYTHAGAPWFQQEWLTQALWYLIFRSVGGEGLAVLKIAIVVASLALAARLAWHRSGSLLLAVAATVFVVPVCRPFLDIRPQLSTFLGTMLVLTVIDAHRRRPDGGSWRLLTVLPVLTALWVNLHPGFVFGLGVLGLYVVAEATKTRFGLPTDPMPAPRVRALALATTVAALATLLNPEHVRALTAPFSLLGSERGWVEMIMEWKPPELFVEAYFNPIAFSWLLVAQGVLLIGALVAAPRRVDVADALLGVAVAVMALRSRRFVPLFALVSVPLLARHAALVWTRVAGAWLGPPVLSRPPVAAAALILAVVATVHLGVRFIPHARDRLADGLFAGLNYAGFFPRGAAEFLRLNPLPARLWHIYTWGGYLAYQLPDRKIFIDGRGHLVYPIAFFLEHDAAADGSPRWEALLDRYEVSLAVWPTGFAGGLDQVSRDNLIASPNWIRVYDDHHSAVFAHTTRGRAWVDAFERFALRYPETPEAQLFLADTHLGAGHVDRGREIMASILARWPTERPAWRDGAVRALARARRDDTGVAWFQAGFAHDVLGDSAVAAEAYGTALARGLSGGNAAWLRTALARLGAPSTARDGP